MAVLWTLAAGAAAAQGCHEVTLAGPESAGPALAQRAEALGGAAEGLTVILPEGVDPGWASPLLTRPGRLSFHAIIGSQGEIDPEGALLDHVTVAVAEVQEGAGGPVLFLALAEDDAARLAEITAGHVGDTLAVALDGDVVVAPRVIEPIHGGELVIAADVGHDRMDEMARLVAAPLPAPLEIVSVTGVDCPVAAEEN